MSDDLKLSPVIRVVTHAPHMLEPPPMPKGENVEPEQAGPLTKLRRLRLELLAWKSAGCPMTPRAVRRQRIAFCEACKFYKPGGNLGFGECHAPGCGCSRAKLWLATSKCPLNPPKWGAV